MNCAVCKRPLFEGATACIVCGAAVSPPATMGSVGQGPPGPPPPRQMPITDAYAPTRVDPRTVESPQGPFAPTAQSPQNPFAPQQQQQQQQSPQNPFAPPPAAPMYGHASPYGPGVPPPPPIMPYPAQYYAPPMFRTDQPNHIATVGFVCGLLGLFPFWIGFLLCIAAIVCSGFGLQNSGRLPGQRGRGLAIAGLVLGIVFIVPAGCGL